MNNFKKLSREEMKKVSGGTWAIKACSCTGCVGSWTYQNTPSAEQAIADINSYCSTGTGSCS